MAVPPDASDPSSVYGAPDGGPPAYPPAPGGPAPADSWPAEPPPDWSPAEGRAATPPRESTADPAAGPLDAPTEQTRRLAPRPAPEPPASPAAGPAPSGHPPAGPGGPAWSAPVPGPPASPPAPVPRPPATAPMPAAPAAPVRPVPAAGPVGPSPTPPAAPGPFPVGAPPSPFSPGAAAGTGHQPAPATAAAPARGPVLAKAGPDTRAPILALRDEIGKVVVGQEGTLSGLVAALLVRGHVLLEGVPGTAKTLLVKTISAALSLEFKRLQFTPDLMPSDVLGQLIFEVQKGSFRFREGPVFTNLLLADEINRTPPKTQAALLEAMEERQVTIEGSAHALPDPFIVVATQNPVEYEGTYPLPEAQLDRFLFKLHVGYPTFEQEQEVLARHDQGLNPHDVGASGVRPVASAADLEAARLEIDRIRVDPAVLGYMVALVRATREAPALALGVSPRGATALLHAAKAWAWLASLDFVTPDEVKAVAKPALRHRVQLRPELELEGTTADVVLDGLLATTPVPR